MGLTRKTANLDFGTNIKTRNGEFFSSVTTYFAVSWEMKRSKLIISGFTFQNIFHNIPVLKQVDVINSFTNLYYFALSTKQRVVIGFHGELLTHLPSLLNRATEKDSKNLKPKMFSLLFNSPDTSIFILLEKLYRRFHGRNEET